MVIWFTYKNFANNLVKHEHNTNTKKPNYYYATVGFLILQQL